MTTFKICDKSLNDATSLDINETINTFITFLFIIKLIKCTLGNNYSKYVYAIKNTYKISNKI